MEILKRYIAEISKELEINEMNLKEASMRAPARKHFWASKLINHKIELNTLVKSKNTLIKSLMAKAEAASPVTLSKINLEKTVESIDEVKNINENIKETESIIEYLEKVETVFRSMTYDIKNIIEINKLETT